MSFRSPCRVGENHNLNTSLFGVHLRFLSRMPDFSVLEGCRSSKIASGRFSASKDSSEPKFPPNFFSRPSHHRSKIFPKVILVSFWKTSDMLCFLTCPVFLLVKHNFYTFTQGWNDLLNVNCPSGRFFW